MGVRLPAEYQEVEYIQPHGTEWINTGFSPTIETEVVIDFSDFNNNGNAYATPFGLSITGSHVGTYKQNNNRVVFTSFGSSVDVSYNTPYGWENRLVISQSKNGVFENNTRVLSAYSNLTFTATAQNIYVFARSDGSGNAARIVILKLYGLQINDNGIQVRNYIPCYRKSDNKPGMYDLVTKQFFTNQGTGEFLVGPDVIDSISPLMVAWRRMLMKYPELYPVGTNILAKYGAVFVSKHTIDTITGEYVENSSYQASPVYMPISPKYTYWKRGVYPNRGYLSVLAFYDKDKNYISYYWKRDYNDFVIPDIPANARYARIAIPSGSATDVKIIRTA